MTQHEKSAGAACEQFEADLILYYYGELEGAQRTQIEAHTRDCEPCRRTFKELQSILPLTVKPDDPPESFWNDYDRELRRKLSAARQRKTGWRIPASFFQPWALPALTAAAVVALALTFTLGRGPWRAQETAPDDGFFLEVLPMAENLEFYTTMEVLDAMDLLEIMGSPGKTAA